MVSDKAEFLVKEEEFILIIVSGNICKSNMTKNSLEIFSDDIVQTKKRKVVVILLNH